VGVQIRAVLALGSPNPLAMVQSEPSVAFFHSIASLHLPGAILVRRTILELLQSCRILQ